MKLVKFLLILLIPLSGVAVDLPLLSEEMEILNNSKLAKQHALTAKHKIALRFFSVKLYNEKSERIGTLLVDLEAYDTPEIFVKNTQKGLAELSGAHQIRAHQLEELSVFLQSISPANTVFLEWLGIDDELYRGKGLSYLLICSAAKILHRAFGVENIILDDSSNIPSYYENIGFRTLLKNNYKNLKFAPLAKIYESDRCMKALAPYTN